MDRVENRLEGAGLFRKLSGRQGWRYIPLSGGRYKGTIQLP